MKPVHCHIPLLLDAAVSGYTPDESALIELNTPLVAPSDLSCASEQVHGMREEHRNDPERVSLTIAKQFPGYAETMVHAIAYRLHALYALVDDRALSPWISLDRESCIATIEVPVLQAAVTVPMAMLSSHEGDSRYVSVGFDRDAFICAVLSYDESMRANVA